MHGYTGGGNTCRRFREWAVSSVGKSRVFLFNNQYYMQYAEATVCTSDARKYFKTISIDIDILRQKYRLSISYRKKLDISIY